MSDVDRLFDDYVERYRSGVTADPIEFVEQLEGTDRRELEGLIDGFLRTSPGRAWDPDAYVGSTAERFAERAELSLAGQAGWWPQLLPKLRERAELKRAELVERLARGLGVGDRREKVAEYYHGMEHGSLAASGVADRVLEVLSGILGESAERLREAGSALAPGKPEPGSVAFARTAITDASYDRTVEEALPPPPASPGAASPGRAEEWDEVDELFRGPREG